MATSVDQLLTAAQRLLWQSACPLPPPPDRAAAAGQQRRSHLRAWPDLAAAARHALGAGASTAPDADAEDPGQWLEARLTPTLQLLGRTRAVVQAAQPDPAAAGDPCLLRVAQLLAAAGDALSGPAPAVRRDAGTTDRVLALVAAAATLTAAYTEQSASWRRGRVKQAARHWLDLSAAAHDACLTPANQRRTASATRPVIGLDEASLKADLDAFYRAAANALDPTRAPTTDLPLVARVLAAVHYGAAAGDPTSPRAAAGRAWHAAAAAWIAAVRIPGPPDPPLRHAARAVSTAVTGPLDAREVTAVRLFARDRAADLAAGYLQQIRYGLRSGLYVTAARYLLHVLDPAPTDLLGPARRGQWVTLPMVSPPAAALLDTACAAADAAFYETRRGDAPAPDTPCLRPSLPSRPVPRPVPPTRAGPPRDLAR